MTLLQAKEELLQCLAPLYHNREAEQIVHMILEHITGMNRTDRAIYKQRALSSEQVHQVTLYGNELASGKPVQYVLGETWFAGLRFMVNEHTLIPRPETEELIEWVKAAAMPEPQSVLDIGTGSGCIPVTLKKIFPLWRVQSIDLSIGALQIAEENAKQHGTEIIFSQIDFLNENNWSGFAQFDIIISNPPYIKISESNVMAKHVLNHEPHLALFVPDDDALIFYKKIALFGKTHLKRKGMVFLEINQLLGTEVCTVFEKTGYKTTLRKDLNENDRMVMAQLN